MKVFIAGGTSGIGFATATKYLDAGHNVGICGRDIQKVSLPNDYPLLKMYQLDIYDREALRNAICDFAGQELDIMIIAAGSYADDSLHKLNYKDSRDMLRVNIVGVINALETATEAMYHRQQGHIAIVASVSALLHYPKATIYSKTKRAVMQISDAYRKALSSFGITITIVAPGYVNTAKLQDLNDGDLSKKPFVVNSEYAADQIIKGIENRRELVIFPPTMKYLMLFMSYLPSWFVNYIMYLKAKWSQKR